MSAEATKEEQWDLHGNRETFQICSSVEYIGNKWEVLVRTKRHRYDCFIEVVKGKRTVLFLMREEHEHGENEESN